MRRGELPRADKRCSSITSDSTQAVTINKYFVTRFACKLI